MSVEFCEGEATLFKEPVEWPNPVVMRHDGVDQLWGLGHRANTFAQVYENEHVRKYTRGLCHAHAAASVETHGGRVVGLLLSGKVVHVLSLHACEDFLFTKDVTGDEAWPEDWEFTPDDFRWLSEKHLLGCPIDAVVIADVVPWTLPCVAPTTEEVSDVRWCRSVLAEPGARCASPSDEDFSPGF